MWTRKSWMGWVGLAALALLPPLVGCRSSREYDGGGGGGCGGGGCRGQSPGGSLVSASAPPGPANHPGGGTSGNPAGTVASPSAEGLYGGQRTCPVTGETLGSMGSPVPVTLSGQTVYVCCRACVAKAQRDPDVYLQKGQAERAGAPGGSH